MWVRRINAEAITQSNFQHLLHEDLEAVDLLVGGHHPEPLEVLLGVLLLRQALHIGHPVQSQVVGVLQVAGDRGEVAVGAVEKLGAKELEEEAGGAEDVGVEDLHARRGEAVDLEGARKNLRCLLPRGKRGASTWRGLKGPGSEAEEGGAWQVHSVSLLLSSCLSSGRLEGTRCGHPERTLRKHQRLPARETAMQ